MKQLIATLVAAAFAAFTFTAFAADEAKPAAETKHHHKKMHKETHKEMHKEEAKAGAGEKK